MTTPPGAADRLAEARRVYREVMAVDYGRAPDPYGDATLGYVFGEVWARPGLSRRDRRWVTLAAISAADATPAIEAHVRAALRSGDVTYDELLEFALHFAVYSGWPKASHVEGIIRRQWAVLHAEQGLEVPPPASLPLASLGPSEPAERVRSGELCFEEVNLQPAPPPETPYTQAGILGFVFGHVWQRPGLGRRDRRLVTLACVGFADAPVPIQSHVGSALASGDLSFEELMEVALHFSVYAGTAKADVLGEAAIEAHRCLEESRPAKAEG